MIHEYEKFSFIEECVDCSAEDSADGGMLIVFDVSPRFMNLCIHKLKCLATNEMEMEYYASKKSYVDIGKAYNMLTHCVENIDIEEGVRDKWKQIKVKVASKYENLWLAKLDDLMCTGKEVEFFPS